MDGKTFKKLAENSHSYYEVDDWLFLRELVQNSRDSGCDKIEINVFQYEFGYELITISDNGIGMNKSDIEKFLFRLYSSSKESDFNKIGMFGVGFWTVLKFNPIEIKIETVKGNEKNTIILDEDLKIKFDNKVSISQGTKIILKRKKVFESKDDFVQKVREKIEKYCKFATGISKRGLEIKFNNVVISKPLSLEEKGYISFRKGDLRGVVGFSNSPEVTLFKGGIPLWNGRFLEELSGEISSNLSSFSGPGLAPVFLIDGDGFESVISRKKVKQSKYLKFALKTAETALNQLLKGYSNNAFQNNYKEKFNFSIAFFKFINGIKALKSYKKLILTLLCIPLLFVFLYFIPFGKNSVKDTSMNYSSPLIENTQYQGAKIDTGAAQTFIFSYFPTKFHIFTLFKAEKFDNEKGFVEGNSELQNTINENEIKGKIVNIKLFVNKVGQYFLPIPNGGIIIPQSFQLNKLPIKPKIIEKSGGFLILFSNSGNLTYDCLIPDIRLNQNNNVNEFTKLPDNVEIPESLLNEINSISKGTIKEKYEKAISLTLKFCKPLSRSDSTEVFNNKDKSWLYKVVETGKGDCDVVNGLFVFILRKLGIPSRLVIGFAGVNGKAVSGYHAWAEYFINGWKTKDLSLTVDKNSPLKDENVIAVSNKENDSENINYLDYFNHSYKYLLKNNYHYVVSIFIVLFLIVIFQRRKTFKQQIIGDLKRDEIKSTLGELLVRAVIQPDLWKNLSEIFNQKVIPTIDGNLFSINDLKILASKRKLFSGSNNSQWSLEFTKRSYVVLDKKDKYFSNLVSILHGVVDLEKLEQIEKSASTKDGKLDSLECRFIEIFKNLSKGKIRIIFADQSKSIKLSDFQLPKTKVRKMYSGKIIVINRKCLKMENIFITFNEKPILLMMKIGDFVIRKSLFFQKRREKYLEILAKNLLNEAKDNE